MSLEHSVETVVGTIGTGVETALETVAIYIETVTRFINNLNIHAFRRHSTVSNKFPTVSRTVSTTPIQFLHAVAQNTSNEPLLC